VPLRGIISSASNVVATLDIRAHLVGAISSTSRIRGRAGLASEKQYEHRFGGRILTW
jgi:hypothetical protein